MRKINEEILMKHYKCSWRSELYQAIALNPNVDLILDAMEEAGREAVVSYSDYKTENSTKNYIHEK